MRPWELKDKEAWKNDAGSRGCWCSSRQFLGATLVQHIHLWFKVCCSSFFLACRGSTLVTQKLMHRILTLKLWNSFFTMIWRSLFMVWHIIPLSYKKVILKVFFWWNEGSKCDIKLIKIMQVSQKSLKIWSFSNTLSSDRVTSTLDMVSMIFHGKQLLYIWVKPTLNC